MNVLIGPVFGKSEFYRFFSRESKHLQRLSIDAMKLREIVIASV